MKHPRTTIGALSLSAAAFVALIAHEGWTDNAVIPVKGDVPTIGPGLTKRADGTPVQMGDTIKPVDGIKRSYAHLAKDSEAIKMCVRAPLYQAEFDLLNDFAYQYGTSATCRSSMVAHINALRYAEACQAYGLYKRVAGRDCSIRSNGCYGVYTRSMERVRKCMEAQ